MDSIQGETSTNLESFRLKATDVQESRRNYSGYQVNQFFTLEDIRRQDSSGTTETDQITDTSGPQTGFKSGYTKINQVRGLRDKWPVKRSGGY